MKYVFSEPLTIKNANNADPQTLGEALSDLATKAGGELTPKAVIEAARNPSHVLHKHFEWDDAIAAEKYRQEQAREIIRCIRVEDNPDDEPARAFLSVTSRGGVSYRTLSDVQQSSDLQLAVLKAAERDLDAFERRYRELTEICDLVRAAKSSVRKRREKIETRTVA